MACFGRLLWRCAVAGSVLLLLGASPSPTWLLEWDWAGTTGDVFTIERCTQYPNRCVMLPVASVPITERAWRDEDPHPQQPSCYRLVAVAGSVHGSYSNTVCSP
jgi:hypothetical protein